MLVNRHADHENNDKYYRYNSPALDTTYAANKLENCVLEAVDLNGRPLDAVLD